MRQSASIPFLVLCMVLPGLTSPHVLASDPSLEGIWLGTLEVPGTELRIAVTIAEADEQLTASFRSVDQGSPDLPFEEVRYEAPRIFFGAKALRLEIECSVGQELEKMECEFRQGGGSFPLLLKRVDKIPRLSRPQEPSPPYPYHEEEVTYDNPRAGVKLAATLTYPEEGGPFPAVVLLTGSGPQNRDEEVFGHKPFLVLADHLTRNGIAVLRADDRGIGRSGGDFRTSTTGDFADDGLAGIEFLGGRPEIDSSRIGLIGHSEGAMMAPIAASRSDHVAFIVMLAGPGTSFDEIILFQRNLLTMQRGTTAEAAALSRWWYKNLYRVSASALEDDGARTLLRQLWTELDQETRTRLNWDDARFEEELPGLLRPWWRYAMAYDPIGTLIQVKCPVLALNGGKDMQVPGAENSAAIERALKLGENPSFMVRLMPGLNHLFQTAESGREDEYTRIEETISPAVLEVISEWILTLDDR